MKLRHVVMLMACSVVSSEWNPIEIHDTFSLLSYVRERPTNIKLPVQVMRTTISSAEAMTAALLYVAGGEVADAVLVTSADEKKPPMLYILRKGSTVYEVMAFPGLTHVHEEHGPSSFVMANR